MGMGMDIDIDRGSEKGKDEADILVAVEYRDFA